MSMLKHSRIFLRCSNRENVFLEQFKKVFSYVKHESLLDIGAGDGSLAWPLSKLVEKYMAVERDPAHANMLRAGRLPVWESDFSVHGSEIRDGIFDIVLVCHSLPEEAAAREIFIREAYRKVAPGGRLIVVTFDDSGCWCDLLRESGLEDFSKPGGLVALREFFGRNFGTTLERHVETRVVSDNMVEMRQALAFVYSNGEEQKFDRFMRSEKVISYLTREFQTGYLHGSIRFPFEHLWFIIAK